MEAVIGSLERDYCLMMVISEELQREKALKMFRSKLLSSYSDLYENSSLNFFHNILHHNNGFSLFINKLLSRSSCTFNSIIKLPSNHD